MSKFFPGPLISAAEGIPGSLVFTHEITKLATPSWKKKQKKNFKFIASSNIDWVPAMCQPLFQPLGLGHRDDGDEHGAAAEMEWGRPIQVTFRRRDAELGM